MRALFLLLLLANALFLAWTQWVAPSPAAAHEDPASAVALRLRPIRLQQELRADGALPTGMEPANCVSVGPFLERPQAQAAAATLRSRGFTSRLRHVREPVRVGFWVRVSNLATPEDASNALATLQAAGLEDAYVIADGTPGNAVSLGVFASADRAVAAGAVAARAGFATETSDRLRTLDVHWLDVDRERNGGVPAIDELGTSSETALPIELRSCPGATSEAMVRRDE